MIKNSLIVLGMLLQMATIVPYWIEAFKGRARPNIVSWFTWTLLTGIGSAVAFAHGDWPAGLVIAANGLATGSIVVLGFWRGYAQLTRFDVSCQVIALLGLASWPLLHDPLLALLLVVAIDAIAFLLTLKHAYRFPFEEPWVAFVFAASGSMCGLLALTDFSILNSLYLIYLVAADTILPIVILWRRRAVNALKVEP